MVKMMETSEPVPATGKEAATEEKVRDLIAEKNTPEKDPKKKEIGIYYFDLLVLN